MAHFAKLDENNIVIEKIVADQEFVDNLTETYVQTSYNTQFGKHALGGTPLRWNFAGIGDYYNAEMDEFHPAKPFDSWLFDKIKREWNPPLTYPTDGKDYIWDEATYLEDNTKGWIEDSS